MEFISYAQAVTITAKSEKTIRRLVSNFRGTNKVRKEGRTILFDRLILGKLDDRQNVQHSPEITTRETEALKDHIQSLKEQISDLQKRLDDKDRLLEAIDAKLIALFEGKPSNGSVMRIIPTSIEEAQSETVDPDLSEAKLSRQEWLSRLQSKQA